jgi:ribonuclease HII
MSKRDWVPVEIIEDDDMLDNEEDTFEIEVPSSRGKKRDNMSNKNQPKDDNLHIDIKPAKIRKPPVCLSKFYKEDLHIIEIGSDEAGRGPLFGRVYSAAVVLPKDDSFDHHKMKDSKKFHSKKKIEEVADYIKENAIAWSVKYSDETTIDTINILQATQQAMHDAITDVKNQIMQLNTSLKPSDILLLIDGNYFNPLTHFNKTANKIEYIPYKMIEGGDNKYTSIAAASILAKVERDNYIEELCEENPELAERYGIDSNKGYGAKRHLDGIKQYGITKWHRRSFGICKEYA